MGEDVKRRQNNEGKILLTKLKINVFGPRGGKIPLSRNALKPFYNPKAVKQIPAWVTYSAAKKHWQKNIKFAYELNVAPPSNNFRRYVLFNRLIPKHGKRYDDDNFSGGCKPVRDVLTEHGYIFDDDPKHLKCKYIQTTGISDTHLLMITIWGDVTENNDHEIDISQW